MDTSSARPHSPSNDYPVRQLIILCEWPLRITILRMLLLPILICFSYIALCRICEPIAFCSLFPYIYYMVDSFKIAVSIAASGSHGHDFKMVIARKMIMRLLCTREW